MMMMMMMIILIMITTLLSLLTVTKEALPMSKTRKLHYRKYDHSMHPIYQCIENFRESMSMPMATFPKLLMGVCSDRSYKCADKI